MPASNKASLRFLCYGTLLNVLKRFDDDIQTEALWLVLNSNPWNERFIVKRIEAVETSDEPIDPPDVTES